MQLPDSAQDRPSSFPIFGGATTSASSFFATPCPNCNGWSVRVRRIVMKHLDFFIAALREKSPQRIQRQPGRGRGQSTERLVRPAFDMDLSPQAMLNLSR